MKDTKFKLKRSPNKKTKSMMASKKALKVKMMMKRWMMISMETSKKLTFKIMRMRRMMMKRK
jgi:hypothetical protein